LTSWDGGEIEGYEDEDGEDVEEAEEIPDLMLLTEDTASEQLQEDMRLWSVANLVTLMSQFDLETMLKVYDGPSSDMDSLQWKQGCGRLEKRGRKVTFPFCGRFCVVHVLSNKARD
jgi:hypothetical protein